MFATGSSRKIFIVNDLVARQTVISNTDLDLHQVQGIKLSQSSSKIQAKISPYFSQKLRKYIVDLDDFK